MKTSSQTRAFFSLSCRRSKDRLNYAERNELTVNRIRSHTGIQVDSVWLTVWFVFFTGTEREKQDAMKRFRRAPVRFFGDDWQHEVIIKSDHRRLKFSWSKQYKDSFSLILLLLNVIKSIRAEAILGNSFSNFCDRQSVRHWFNRTSEESSLDRIAPDTERTNMLFAAISNLLRWRTSFNDDFFSSLEGFAIITELDIPVNPFPAQHETYLLCMP